MGGIFCCLFFCCCMMAKTYRHDGHLQNYTQAAWCVTGDECIGCVAIVHWDIIQDPDGDEEEDDSPKKKKKK